MDDLVLFDIMYMHIPGPRHYTEIVADWHDDDFWTLTNGWDTTSATLTREGDGQSSDGVATWIGSSGSGTFIGFNGLPVDLDTHNNAGDVYLSRLKHSVENTSGGTSSHTFGGTTIYSGTGNYSSGYNIDYKAIYTSTDASWISTAHGTTDMTIYELSGLWRLLRGGAMFNMTATSNIVRNGLKAKGAGGGGSGAQ